METLECNVHDCALVFEGGGYRESFSGGIANVLLEQGIYFDFVCGLSAGASSTVNYISRDRWRMRESFLTGKRMGDTSGVRSILRGTRYFDAEAIYEESACNGRLPFDWKTFQANPAQLCIQAFQRDSGRTVRFTKSDMTDVIRLMDLVRASSTLPVVMKELPVDGKIYYDGGLGEGAGLPLYLAESAGYDKFFFVATREQGYRKKPPSKIEVEYYKHIARGYPYYRNALLTRWERYNTEIERIEHLAAEGRAYIVYPDQMRVSSGTIDNKKLIESYEQGHSQGIRDISQWRTFLFGSPTAGPAAPVTSTVNVLNSLN